MPDDLQGYVPHWSPDGSMFILDGRGIYTARPDYTGMNAVTIVPVADIGHVTGRVVTIRWPGD